MINNLILALYGGTCVKIYMDASMSLVTIGLDQTASYTVGSLICTNAANIGNGLIVAAGGSNVGWLGRRHWGLDCSKRWWRHD